MWFFLSVVTNSSVSKNKQQQNIFWMTGRTIGNWNCATTLFCIALVRPVYCTPVHGCNHITLLRWQPIRCTLLIRQSNRTLVRWLVINLLSSQNKDFFVLYGSSFCETFSSSCNIYRSSNPPWVSSPQTNMQVVSWILGGLLLLST